MLSIKQITKNIQKGQQSIPIKYIFAGLDVFYAKIKSKISIVHCSQDLKSTQIHFKIPSEDKSAFYDVVLWFMELKKTTIDTELKVYSNSPHFVYNFAYVFNQNNSLLFPEKYDNTVTTNPPVVRNPFQTAGFDKHVYAALKYSYQMDLKASTEFFIGKTDLDIYTVEQMKRIMDSAPKKLVKK